MYRIRMQLLFEMIISTKLTGPERTNVGQLTQRMKKARTMIKIIQDGNEQEQHIVHKRMAATELASCFMLQINPQ